MAGESCGEGGGVEREREGRIVRESWGRRSRERGWIEREIESFSSLLYPTGINENESLFIWGTAIFVSLHATRSMPSRIMLCRRDG